MKPIPIVWRIDVEPDDFQPGAGLPPWTGFVSMVELVDELRARLAGLSETAVRPTWFLRLDPDVERAYGRADFVLEEYPQVFERLRTAGDAFGIHVHYYRWDDERQTSYSEHADEAWVAHCFDVAASTFERRFGERPRRMSQGAFYLSNVVIDRAIASGVEVDVTVEPGLPAQAGGQTFGAFATAASPDYADFPRRPYYPSGDELSRPAASAADRRPLLMVPLTAYDYPRALSPWHRRLAKTLLRWPRRHLPLNLHKVWPDPETYWDLVERAADEGPARYVALAVRTDARDSLTGPRARLLLEHLPKHRIARRLRFVDPLSPEIRALAETANHR